MFADGLWGGGHLIGSFRASVHSAESPTISSGPGGHFQLPTRGSLPRLGLVRRAIPRGPSSERGRLAVEIGTIERAARNLHHGKS